MKKITFLILSLFLTAISWQVHAQCTATTQYPAATFTPSAGTGFQTLSTCNFAGEFAVVSVTAGDTYVFSTCPADGATAPYDTQLTLRTTAGALLAYNDDFCGIQSKITWVSTITGTVRLHLHQYNCATNFTCTAIRVSRTSPPPNNLCVNATLITGNGTYPGTTLASTNSAAGTCVVTNTSGDVWYTFTDVSGTGMNVTANTCSAIGYDTKLSVFSGSCGALVCVTGNDDAACALGSFRSAVNFTTDGSSTYYIMVHGIGTATGNFELNISGIMIGNPPQIICPNDIVINNTTGTCGAQVFFNNAQAFDAEDGLLPVTQTMGPGTGSVFPIGHTIIEYSTTDSDGNTSTCQFTITVVDVDDPIAVCQDITVELDESGTVTIFAEDLNFGSGSPDPATPISCTGNPGPTSVADSNLLNFSIVGENFTEINYTNSCPGVTGLQNQTALSVDLIPGETYTVNATSWTCGGTQYAAQTYVWIDFNGDGELTSNEVVLTGAQVFVSGGGPTGANPTGGNPFSNSFTVPADAVPGSVIIRAMTQETATTPLLPCASYSWGSMIDFTANLTAAGQGSSDGCGPVTFSFDEDGLVTSMVLDCSNLGENTITLYVTDEGGNVVSCESTVTVEDNIAPEIVCLGGGTPVYTTINCSGNPGPSSVADSNLLSFSIAGENGSEIDFLNGCPGVTGVQNQTALSVDLLPGQTYTVNANSWTCGGSQYTAQTYVWIDFNGDGTLTADEVVLTGAQVFVSGGGPTGANPTGGNPFTDTFTVPANAYQGPVAIRVMTQETSVTPLNPCASYTWGSMIDFTANVLNPNPGSVPQYFLDANGEVTVPITDLYDSVSDNASACGVTVTAGGAGGGTSSTLTTGFAGGNGNFGNFFDINALEDVTIDSFDLNLDTGAVLDIEIYFKEGTWVGSQTTPANWTLIGTAPGTVSAGDGVPTVLNLDLSQTIAAGETGAFYITAPVVSSGGFNYTNGTGTGNVWASDDNIEFLEGGAVGGYFTGTLFQPRVFNGNIHYTTGGGAGSGLTFTCADLGFVNVTVTATDASGNSSSCVTQIEIIDNIAPVVVGEDITVELGPDGTVCIVPEDLFGIIPPDYNVITISSDNGSGSFGFTDLVVTVTQNVSVSFDWSYTTNDGPGFDSFGYIINGVYTQLTNPSGANNQTGNATVPLTAGQVFGFRSRSEDGAFGPSTTTVSNFQPGFTGQFDPSNWTQVLTNSDGSAVFVEITPGSSSASDNCGITVTAIDISCFTCADIGTPVTVTIFVSDASGNIASTTAVVTVVDVLGPVIDCPADMTVDTDPNSITYTLPDFIGDGLVNVTDNCTEPVTVFSQTPAPGTLLVDGTYTITLTAEDEYGNETICSFELTVDTILGTDEIELGNAIAMYPNPASGFVNLRNNSTIALTDASIYDITGKLVSKFDLSQMIEEQRLDVSNLASGVYIVYINSETASVVKRLIKK